MHVPESITRPGGRVLWLATPGTVLLPLGELRKGIFLRLQRLKDVGGWSPRENQCADPGREDG